MSSGRSGKPMPQDRESGLRASRYGKECARRIAAAIGAQMLGKKSNECVWNGERALTKSAHHKTTSVGVLYHMTGKIDAVLGAFQNSPELLVANHTHHFTPFQVGVPPTAERYSASAFAPLIFEYKLPVVQFPDGALVFVGFPTTHVVVSS